MAEEEARYLVQAPVPEQFSAQAADSTSTSTSIRYVRSLNDPVQVKKLQVFLNMNLGLNLAVNGVYNAATIAAVNQFQVKYHIEVLAPWVPLGLPTQFTPTSYVYQTTQRWINLIMCPPLNIPMPTLQVDNGGE